MVTVCYNDGMSMERIVLIGGAPAIVSAEATLRELGFDVVAAAHGPEGLTLATLLVPALVLIDFEQLEGSGVALCTSLKADARTAESSVIMLSSDGSESRRLAAFEAGADNFVTTPVSPRELILRVRAVLRRRSSLKRAADLRSFRAGGLLLDADAARAKVAGADLELTLLEFRLLWTLATRPGGVFEREALLHDVWGPAVKVEVRTVDQHVKRLRKKLGPARKLLRTIRGVDYRFESTAEG